MTVTVCVPAYRAGRFLARTLASALAQTHADLRIEVGVDPCAHDGSGDDHDTLRALAPFRTDPRVVVHHNPHRLGWDGNVRALLQRVRTPWVVVLPHDDLWHPRFVAALLGELRADPAAVVAYADQATFGWGPSTHKRVAMPAGASPRAQWLAFLLQGAEALPWRGLTRADQRAAIGDFPVDGHRGFAVECEYAFALLLAGAARHRPESLYYKRLHADGVASASRDRVHGVPVAERQRAWAAHGARMRAQLAAGLQRTRDDALADDLLRAALEAMLLRRHQLAVAPCLANDDLRQIDAWLDALARHRTPEANAVRSRLHAVLARHADASGAAAAARRHAEQAVEADPSFPEAWLLLAAHFAGAERFDEAQACVARTEALAPALAETRALRERFPRLAAVPA
jgi:hypothetical protein